MMNAKLLSQGTTKFAWVEYEGLSSPSITQHIQVVEWANGEGLSVIRNDDSTLNLDWEEWDALKLAVRKLS